MKILVFGLGALGTVFATCLKSQGHNVFGFTKKKYINQLKDKKIENNRPFWRKRSHVG